MTDNISRLYRLNNIDKVFYASDNVFEDGYDLNSIKEDYPPFTNTKQLELIKWFGKNSIMKKVYDIYNREDFSQALAGLVCELWDDLTPEQREEIKRILK